METPPYLEHLTPEAGAVALALCRIQPAGPYPAADAKELAEQILQRRLSKVSYRMTVLKSLRDHGYIELYQRRAGALRTTLVQTLPLFNAEVLVPYLSSSMDELDDAMKKYFVGDSKDIYARFTSEDVDVRADGLTGLAVHIMRLMGLHFVGWRERAEMSHEGRYLSLVAAGITGNKPTRWHLSCRNTPLQIVDTGNVAREVGLALLTKASHVLIATNGTIGEDAVGYSEQLAVQTPMNVVLLDGKELDAIRRSPAALAVLVTDKLRRTSWLRHGALPSQAFVVEA